MIKFGTTFLTSVYGLYKEMNTANLSGAIDVIVVEQPDGSLKSTPFYVRFGKVGVLRSREKIVDVQINQEQCNEFTLKLNDNGEAFFVFPDITKQEHSIKAHSSDIASCPDFSSFKKPKTKNTKPEQKSSHRKISESPNQPQTSRRSKIDNADHETTESSSRKISWSYGSENNFDFKKLLPPDGTASKPKSILKSISENTKLFPDDVEKLVEFHYQNDDSSSRVKFDLESADQQEPVLARLQKKSIYYSTDEEFDEFEDFDSERFSSISSGSQFSREQSNDPTKSSSFVSLDDYAQLSLNISQIQQPLEDLPGSLPKDSYLLSGLALYSRMQEKEIMDIETFLNIYAISNCGVCVQHLENLVTKNEFDAQKLALHNFMQNPEVIFSKKLVIQFPKHRFFNYKVAIPMLINCLVFQNTASATFIDKLFSKSGSKIRLIDSAVPESNINSKTQTAGTIDHKSTSYHYSYSNLWYWWRRAGSVEPPDKIVNPTISNLKRSDSSTSLTEKRKEIDTKNQSAFQTKPLFTIPSRFNVLPSEILAKLKLNRDVPNNCTFSVTTKFQGTCSLECDIYLWRWDDRIVISDIDGTITRSDVLGHLMPLVGRQWEHASVAKLFRKLCSNGYKIVYLSARAIGQSFFTRQYLENINQSGQYLPPGPIQLSPTSLISALHREIIEKKPEIFKIECLATIRAIFPSDADPFYAGFGNKINDEMAYSISGISKSRIFIVDALGNVQSLNKRIRSSYERISDLVDEVFPPLKITSYGRRTSNFRAADHFSCYTFWRQKSHEF